MKITTRFFSSLDHPHTVAADVRIPYMQGDDVFKMYIGHEGRPRRIMVEMTRAEALDLIHKMRCRLGNE